MQLHTLTFRAIGPFAADHTIDFGDLGRSGLFLLDGPTGAGKSTIIDAVVFALYGGVAGESNSKQRLHSHHAAPGVEPFVDLTFEVNAGIFRIRRSPAYARPKSRGSGFTEQNEKVSLSRLANIDADFGELVSHRNQEVGAEIPRIIGLDRKQFLQTVVLPQGEFAKFLRSSGEERKTLLQTIFRTEVYEVLTRQLIEMRKSARKECAAAEQSVQRSIAAFTANAQIGDDVVLGEGFGSLLRDECAKIVADLRIQHDEVSRKERVKLAELEFASAFAKEQEDLQRLLDRRTDLLRQKDRLEQTRHSIDEGRQTVVAAHRARVVQPFIVQFRNADDALASAAAVLIVAQTRAATDNVDLAELTERRDAASTELVKLARLVDLEKAFATRDNEIDESRLALAELDTDIQKLDESLSDGPAVKRLLEEQRTTYTTMAAEERGLQTARDESAGVLAAAQRRDSNTERLRGARDELANAHRAATHAVEREGGLRMLRIDNMAGIFADSLVDHEPCAVCGATEHPKPAQKKGQPPTEAEVEQAEIQRQEAERGAAAVKNDVLRLETETASLDERAMGLTVEAAVTALTAAETRVAAASAAAQKLEIVNKQLATFETRGAAEAAEQSDKKARHAALSADYSRDVAELARDKASIAAAIDGKAASLADLVSGLDRRVAVVTELIAAIKGHADAVARCEERRGEVENALLDNEFVTIEAAERAAAVADLEGLEAQVNEYDAQCTIVSAALTEPLIVALTGAEQPQLDIANAKASATKHAHTAVSQEAHVLSERLRVTTGSFAELSRVIDDYQSHNASAEAVIKMAGIADATSAHNQKALSLGTYVLIRRFEQVIHAANARLSTMSNGRYQLNCIGERESSGSSRKTGLALEVVDGETNRPREPKTLSGGETFYVSLCLALGLADVVTAEAGGTDLRTLFVDEGFGSLDPETLDKVMTELGHLSRGGRTVGIVSHVEELKQRVADRIEVRRRDDGSSTLTVKATTS